MRPIWTKKEKMIFFYNQRGTRGEDVNWCHAMHFLHLHCISFCCRINIFNLGIIDKFVIANSFSCIFITYGGINFDVWVTRHHLENTGLANFSSMSPNRNFVEIIANPLSSRRYFCVWTWWQVITWCLLYICANHDVKCFLFTMLPCMAMQAFLSTISVKFNFEIQKSNKKKFFVCTSSNCNLYINELNLHFYFVL